MYKFELRLRPKAAKKGNKKKEDVQITGIEEQAGKEPKANEESSEINHYIGIKEVFDTNNIAYSANKIKINGKKYNYSAEKANSKYQELWEKTGFYQERTTQAKVRVQLWPEHLPYDHFKRKRAFLFC